MTTTVTNTVGSSGRDYSTLDLWEDATDNTSLIAADEIRIASLYADSEFDVGAGGFSLAGATTDATRYRRITTAAGQSFKDNANKLTNALTYNASNGVAITGSPAASNCMTLAEIGARIDNVQIRRTSAGLYALDVVVGSTSTNILRNLIVRNTNGGTCVHISSITATVINSMIINDDPVSQVGIHFEFATAGSGAFNCTIVTPSDGSVTAPGGILVQNSSTNVTLKNNAAFGWGSTPYIGTFNAATNYNATDAGTATGGANDLTGLTFANQFQVVTTASQDFRTKNGSLYTAGLTDTTNTSDLDIVGQTRAGSPTIGAWEFIAGGATSTIPVFMANYRQRR